MFNISDGFQLRGIVPATPPSPGSLLWWMDGQDLDGLRNETLTNNQDLTSVVNKGTRGGTFTNPGTAPKFLLAGGYGSVLFAGSGTTTDRLVSASGSAVAAPITVAVIARQTTNGINAFYLDGLVTGHRINLSQNSTNWPSIGGDTLGFSQTTPTPTVNAYNVLYGVINGASSDLAINGPLFIDQTGTTGTCSATTATGLSIAGAFSGAAVGLAGDIVEVLVWAGNLSSQDIHNYIDRKYSVGWPKTALSHFNFAAFYATPTLPIATGDKIVVIGDSITSGVSNEGTVPWFNPYKAWVQGGISGTTWVNAGVGGDTMAMIRARLGTDVIAQSPQVVIVQGGINDLFQRVDIALYMDTIQGIYEDLEVGLPGVKIMYVGPMSRGEFYPDPSNIEVSAYSLAMNSVSYDNDAPFVDTRTPEQNYEAVHNTPPPGSLIADLTTDGTHLKTAGITLWSGLAQTKTVLVP